MNRVRRAGHPRRHVGLALALTLVIVGAACSSSLKDDELNSNEIGGTLEAWPTLERAGTATTPVYPDITLTAREILRTADGTATLFLDVANDGNEDVTVGDIFNTDGIVPISLYDPDGNVEYWPMQIEDDFDSGSCDCSGEWMTLPAGSTMKLHATYVDVAAEVEEVRVNIGQFTPITKVPVMQADRFEAADTAPVVVEYDEDLQVEIEKVQPHEDGTLVTLRYTNKGSGEPVALDAFPNPGGLRLVSTDMTTLFLPREADFEPVATPLSSETTLAKGKSATIEVLLSTIPDDTDAVVLQGGGLVRSRPVNVSDDAGEPTTIAVPADMEEPVIHSMHSPTARYDDPMVPNEQPDLPDVDEMGAELPQPPVAQTLTSPAQPGWSIGVRAIVRGPADLSTLLLDLNRDGSDDSWPEGLGTDDYGEGLGALSVIDPVAQKRYGVVGDEAGALSAGDSSWQPDDGETMPAYAVVGPLDPATTQVSVDIPTFGRVDNIPVVDVPDPTDSVVKSTMRLRGNNDLRMDVLTVSRLPGHNGTLLRVRLVNESSNDTVTAPFATEGSGSDVCDLAVTDPETGEYLWRLPECMGTYWQADLARGEQLVYEVRFPELPDGVETVVLDGGGYFPSLPVRVEDDQRPWYITFPHPAGDPEGGRLIIPEGSADGFETTTITEDTVEVSLSADVLFEFDSAALTPDAAARIADLAARVGEQAAGGTVTITGFSDDVGDEGYNQTLSEQRAEAVRAALEPATGRSDLTFEIEGQGENDPVAPNQINGLDNPDGRARNRRVTIVYEAT